MAEKQTPHKNVYTALAAAQKQYGAALKSANNPHFKSKYADLSSVIDACGEALNENGIAYFQPTCDDENGNRHVETVLYHGDSDTSIKCRVPIIVQKNDMQGYGSAVTYARRYGLMTMAGIAPEDDDGNAAAAAAPKAASREEYTRFETALRNAASIDALNAVAKDLVTSEMPEDWKKNLRDEYKGCKAKLETQALSETIDDNIPEFMQP